MAMLSPLSLLIFALPLFFSPISSLQHFDDLNVHQLIAAATRTQRRHHQPKSSPSPSPSSGHASSELRLNLVHRDEISGRKHPSHRHRIEDLITRDANRVAFLTNKLSKKEGAADSYHVADADDGLRADVVSGLEEGSGEYFVRIGVGSPPRQQFMVIDSGSDIVWVQCQPCTLCYRQSDPVFDPAASASFSGISCASPICGLLSSAAGCGSSSRCLYEVSYGDGSFTKGTLVLETLTLGLTSVRDVAIGCGHRNRGLFVGAAGLLGLGWGPMSLVGQLGAAAGGAFSYCLASRGSATAGTLVFGRTAAVPVGAVWVPLLRNPRAPSFYYVGLVGLGVGGAQLPVHESTFALSLDGDGGAVMDTGTAVTRLPDPAYAALREAFVAGTAGLPRSPGLSIFDTCYDLSGYGSVRVPTVSLYFSSGPVLTLPARNFLIPVDDRGTFCFAFAPSGSALSIVGNIQQEGIQITVDAANGFVGFGPQTC